MYAILGIEAARTVLINEIREVIESSGNYKTVDIFLSFVIL